jgi:alanine-synthesizing transaminase
VVFLPNADDLADAIARIARFLESYRKKHGTENKPVGRRKT